MKLFSAFARAYPVACFTTIFALLVAGIMEGVSLSALLPLLTRAMGQQSPSNSLGSPESSGSDVGPGRVVMDALEQIGIHPSLGGLLILIVMCIFLKNGFLMLANRQVGYTVAQVATDLRLALIRALLVTRWDYYIRQSSGSLVNAVATEANRAAKAYQYGASVVALTIQVLVYLCVAFLVSWRVTLASIVASMCLLYVLSHLIQMARRAGKRQTKLLKSLLRSMTDSLQSVKPLKAMAREVLFNSLLESEITKLNKAIRRQVLSREALRAAQEPMLTILVALGLYITLVQWGMPFANVLVLVLLLTQLLSRLGKVQRQYQEMVTLESAYWSLKETIQKTEQHREDVSGDKAPEFQEVIKFDHVTFAYDVQPVLQDIVLMFPSGSFTSIVGSSGAGKTTIVDLVIGLIRPQRGDVVLDAIPLKEVDIQSWRRMIGYVPQETLLLHDTVLKNVTLGDPELDEGDAEVALRAAGAWEFVQSLPQGLETSVGEHGRSLSGGQRQRIAIARALAHRPRLLILDEATSALDTETEVAICQTLQKLRGRLTILAISHQSGLIDAADRVYRLQDGMATLIVDRAKEEFQLNREREPEKAIEEKDDSARAVTNKIIHNR